MPQTRQIQHQYNTVKDDYSLLDARNHQPLVQWECAVSSISQTIHNECSTHIKAHRLCAEFTLSISSISDLQEDTSNKMILHSQVWSPFKVFQLSWTSPYKWGRNSSKVGYLSWEVLQLLPVSLPTTGESSLCLQCKEYIYIYEYCYTSLSAQSWQYRERRKPEAETMPYSYFEWLQGFFIVHSTIGSTAHSMPLNSLEHCICTTTMTNIPPDRDSNLVPPGYKPQLIRMSHQGWP